MSVKPIRSIIIGLGLCALPILLSAQSLSSGTDSIVQLTADAQNLQPIAPGNLPLVGGTYWVATPDGVAPWPCAPLDSTLPTYAITPNTFLVDMTFGQASTNLPDGETVSVAAALTNLAASVAGVIQQVEGASTKSQMRTMGMMSADDLTPPGDGGTNGYGGYTNSFVPLVLNSNLMWLEVSNVDNASGIVYANLHVATNQVYAIWSATNLATPFADWQVEAEVWPGDTNCQPFTVPAQGRDVLFLRAEDWDGVDANSNGLPDWWEWENFGNFDQTAAGDYDGDGVNNGTEYTNGTDPNKIRFTVRLGGQRFNTTLADGSFAVLGGVPSYAAVLVNDTNFADADWQPYHESITFGLGPNDGAVPVWFGLKGRAPSSTATWIGTTVYLDRTAPVLTITNPTGGTVTRPYIQLQGYADKPLAQVTYDLSNAAGVVTGAAGFVTGQFLDASNLTFATNYWQCFDVPLAEGTNTLTVHGTDMAGNTGSVTTNLVLDYSQATNPPVIAVTWPTDGLTVGQTNITVYGTVSDPTATIRLQVAGDGITNEITGVVERDGRFWFLNVPLTGTNILTLTAADARTNLATMSETVKSQSAGLTIDPVSGDLWESMAPVSGTMPGTNGVVTVNGVAATNDGFGGWLAEQVPINPDNVAVFTAKLTSPDGTNGVQTQLAMIKPPALKLAAAVWQDQQMVLLAGDEPGVLIAAWQWQAGQGGSYESIQRIFQPGGDDLLTTNRAAILADRSVPYVVTTSWTGATQTNELTGSYGWQSDFPQAAGALTVPNPANPAWPAARSGTANWVLHTGLNAAGGQNETYLMELTASAVEETAGGSANVGGIVNGANLPGPDITDLGQPLGVDYLAYAALPDGATVNAPITAAAPLSEISGSATRNDPYIAANGISLSTNIPDFCVGQSVEFHLAGLPAGATATNFQWTLAGIFVNDHTNAVPGGSLPASSENYFENAGLLTNAVLTNCWWVSGGNPPITYDASVTCDLVFTNGKSPLRISAAGQFTMLRPLPSFSVVNMAAVAIRTNEFPSLYLCFGTAQGTNVGMAASLTNVPVDGNNSFYGVYKLVQLAERHCKLNYVAGTNVFGWQRDNQGLDNEYPYGGSDAVIAGQSQLANNPIWTDSPDQVFGWPGRWVSRTDSFQDYLMFQHFSYNSIPVPMYLGAWEWSGSASTTGGMNFSLLSSNVQPPVVNLTIQFPVWTNIVTNNAPWDVTNLPPFIEN